MGKKIEQMLSTIIILAFNVKTFYHKLLPTKKVTHNLKVSQTFMSQKIIPLPLENIMVRLFRGRLKQLDLRASSTTQRAWHCNIIRGRTGHPIQKRNFRRNACTRVKHLTLHVLLNICRRLLVLSLYSLCIVEYRFLCLPNQNIRLSFISFTHYNLTAFTTDIFFQLPFSYLQLIGIINI